MKRLQSFTTVFMTAILLQIPAIAQTAHKAQFGDAQPSSLGGKPVPLTSISLPDIPEYTGIAKLTGATAFPESGKIEKSVSLTYTTRDSASSILDWYRSSLSMYQWTVQTDDPNVLVAVNNRSGNSCSIYCSDGEEGVCNLHISYNFVKPPSDDNP